jgi:hypothetical protein
MISVVSRDGMWKVRVGRKSKVFTRWSRVEDAIRKHEGETIELTELLVDVLIARPNGDFILGEQKLTPQEAAKLSVEYAKIDRGRGIVLWPHGEPYPEGWNVIRREELA